MSRNSKLNDEERIRAVQEYLEGNGSYKVIAGKYGLSPGRLRKLVIRAQIEGIESIRISSTNKKYSRETKIAAVQEYIYLKSSLSEVCKKYHISNDSCLLQWIKCYNSGKYFNERLRSERGVTMKNGKRTTQKERLAIVAFCIEHGKDYQLTMQQYGISYPQIYSWVRKYEAKGVDGLIDRRGKSKPKDELTEADKLRIENKILQARLKGQEIEIKLLKKLWELKGGDR